MSTVHITNPISVLAVDDQRLDLTMLKNQLLLTDIPMEVTTCRSFEEAVKRLEKPGQFDLVILDYFLDEEEGFEVIAQAREAGNLVPFVVVSGKSGELFSRELIKAGASDVLSKPVSSNTLKEVISAILDSNES
ncbi:MAG: response regulator [Vampirovibrio sp.]|nr:response regulator [Vampirovibrio sp.]